MGNLREYEVNGRRAVFNKVGFQQLITQKSRKEKVAKYKLEAQIAKELNVSEDAVHKWNYNGGGPGDYGIVEQLATVLGLQDTSLLITFIDNGGMKMAQLTDRQKSAAKRIYDICIWFLFEFSHTDGFNDYWYEFKKSGSEDPESDIYDLAEGMIRKIELVLDQEYFDLRGCEIYDELCEFVSEDLFDTFNGKLSYAYRFEAMPDGNPTTDEDYNRAMIRLNTIIDKYL